MRISHLANLILLGMGALESGLKKDGFKFSCGIFGNSFEVSYIKISFQVLCVDRTQFDHRGAYTKLLRWS